MLVCTCVYLCVLVCACVGGGGKRAKSAGIEGEAGTEVVPGRWAGVCVCSLCVCVFVCVLCVCNVCLCACARMV